MMGEDDNGRIGRLIRSQYVGWLDSIIDSNLGSESYKTYSVMHQQTASRPFGSVLVRTQGKRDEGLRETLLCLAAQSLQDFEVLILAHKVTEAGSCVIEKAISDQEEWFRSRIRRIDVNQGNRTTPLNYGLAYANGRYFMILDDDDIVMEDWMKTFKDASSDSDEKILHQYAFSQKWSVVKCDGGDGLRAESAPSPEFCVDYEAISQMSTNKCPPVSLAFPISAFREMGFVFDESLSTTEDWDYLMRVGLITGVRNKRVPGCIYRLWVNAENSHTLHDEDEWRKNYLEIRRRLSEYMLVIRESDYTSEVNTSGMIAPAIPVDLSAGQHLVCMLDKTLKEGSFLRNAATAVYRKLLRQRFE